MNVFSVTYFIADFVDEEILETKSEEHIKQIQDT